MLGLRLPMLGKKTLLIFQCLENQSGEGTAFFQCLEEIFPTLGKIRYKFSNHWNPMSELQAIEPLILTLRGKKVIWEKLLPLLVPPEPPKKGRIGFNAHLNEE